MIHVGDKPATMVRGDYEPAELYVGETKIAGWRAQNYTGKQLTVQDTYNDRLSITARGEHSQVTTTGKNLLDPSTEEVHGYNRWAKNPFTEAGVYTIQAFASGSHTWCCYVSDANGDSVQYLRSYITGDHPTTVTIEEQAVSAPYILVGPRKNPGPYSLSGWQMMVEKGETASTAYEPYTGRKAAPNPDYPQEIKAVDALEISINDVQHTHPFSPPLHGSNDIYDTWENDVVVDGVRRSRLTRWHGRLAIDGDAIKFTPISSGRYWNLPYYSSPGIIEKRNVLCTHFPRGKVFENSKYDFAYTTPTHMQGYFETADALNEFCAAQSAAGTPVTIIYQLETPEITLGDPVPLRTHPHSTVITSNAELSANIKTVEH